MREIDTSEWVEELEVRFHVWAFAVFIGRLLRQRDKKGLELERPHGKELERVLHYDTPDREYREQGLRIRIKEYPGRKQKPWVVQCKAKQNDALIEVDGTPRAVKRRLENPKQPTFNSRKEAEAFLAEAYPDAVRTFEEGDHEKSRDRWILAGAAKIDFVICHDLLHKPYYIEIEASTPEQIVEIAESLGLRWDDATTKSYRTEHKDVRLFAKRRRDEAWR